MADAYKVLQDTSLPRALALISEDEIQGKRYETEGRNYAAGDYVLRKDITPSLHEEIDNGDWDHLLEEVDLEEANAALFAVERSVFAPEHEVEALALQQYGHKILDRNEIIAARSLGAEDASTAQQEAKADGADERPNLTFEEQPLMNDDEVAAQRIKDAEESYVDAEVAEAERLQVLPSGVVATNPFVEKAAARDEEESAPRTTSRRKRKPDPQATPPSPTAPSAENQE